MSESAPTAYRDFGFTTAEVSHMHKYFMPVIRDLLGELKPGTRVLDVGCGNGCTCGEFLKLGCKVTGIDLSEQGIAQARQAYPEGRFEVLPADEHILANLGEEPFDVVISTEVVEHLCFPRPYARGCCKALKPGGRFICSTPYHGYLKNLLLSVCNKWDTHLCPMWDGGHIKLWSRKTLHWLLSEQGFVELQFRGVGRIPWLWMTMVFYGRKPV
ncbi:MAG: class I SAM-dependent methyltransferase [Prosthecobacter sp.]|uniref:class I SAM-dependent methyltransferase n=1 Tax=Prosthecobacter sp. TaxID=1965333 RepID=UPI003900151F